VLSIMPKLCWKSVNSSGERSKEGRKKGFLGVLAGIGRRICFGCFVLSSIWAHCNEWNSGIRVLGGVCTFTLGWMGCFVALVHLSGVSIAGIWEGVPVLFLL